MVLQMLMTTVTLKPIKIVMMAIDKDDAVNNDRCQC